MVHCISNFPFISIFLGLYLAVFHLHTAEIPSCFQKRLLPSPPPPQLALCSVGQSKSTLHLPLWPVFSLLFIDALVASLLSTTATTPGRAACNSCHSLPSPHLTPVLTQLPLGCDARGFVGSFGRMGYRGGSVSTMGIFCPVFLFQQGTLPTTGYKALDSFSFFGTVPVFDYP